MLARRRVYNARMQRGGERLQGWHYRYLRCGVGSLFAALGVRRALRFAEWLAGGVYDLNTPSRKLAERNLACALGNELDQAQRERIIRGSFLHLGRFWIEAIYLRRLLRAGNWRQRVRIREPALWRGLAGDRRGAIVVTTYLGNVAVLGYALNQLLGGVGVLIKLAEQPVLRAWIDEVCRVPGVELIHAEQALARLPAALRGGRSVLMIGEHVRRRGRGVKVRMLGRDRRFYPTAAVLAWGCQVPLVVATCRRSDGDMQFSIETQAVFEPPACGDRDALDELTRRYAVALEQAICAHPEQYAWARRWDPASYEDADSRRDMTSQ